MTIQSIHLFGSGGTSSGIVCTCKKSRIQLVFSDEWSRAHKTETSSLFLIFQKSFLAHFANSVSLLRCWCFYISSSFSLSPFKELTRKNFDGQKENEENFLLFSLAAMKKWNLRNLETPAQKKNYSRMRELVKCIIKLLRSTNFISSRGEVDFTSQETFNFNNPLSGRESLSSGRRREFLKKLMKSDSPRHGRESHTREF